MSEQLDIFSREIIPVPQHCETIEERAREFFRLNGHVISAFVMLAREYLKKTGSKHVGAKMLWEKMRFEFAIHTKDDGSGYRLNNNYTAYLARLVAETHDDLKDVFEFRRLRSVA